MIIENFHNDSRNKLFNLIMTSKFDVICNTFYTRLPDLLLFATLSAPDLGRLGVNLKSP